MDLFDDDELSRDELKSRKAAAKPSTAKSSVDSDVELLEEEDYSPRSHSSGRVVIDTSANISATYDPESALSALTDEGSKRGSRIAKKFSKKAVVDTSLEVPLKYYQGYEKKDGTRTFADTVNEDRRLRRNGFNFCKAFASLEQALAWIDLADEKVPPQASLIESSDDEGSEKGDANASATRSKRALKPKKSSKSKGPVKRSGKRSGKSKSSTVTSHSSRTVVDSGSDDPSSPSSASASSSSSSSSGRKKVSWEVKTPSFLVQPFFLQLLIVQQFLIIR